jgi:TolA-binding protein
VFTDRPPHRRLLLPLNRRGPAPLFSIPRLLLLVSAALLLLPPLPALASASSRLQRIEVQSGATATRLRFKLQGFAGVAVTNPSATVLRLRFTGATAPRFKQLQSLKGRHVRGVVVRLRMGDALVDITASDGTCGFRVTQLPDAGVVTVDVGQAFKGRSGIQVLPGRERILQGAEKLVRDFESPIKGLLPFVPSDQNVLKKVLADGEVKLLLAGEAALYKGWDTDAVTAFTSLSPTDPHMRGLVTYRLGEALYGLQKYAEAIRTFGAAEQLWPEFLSSNPTTAYSYGDSLIRTGSYARGRKELTRLLTQGADKPYAPILMVRLGDVLALQGDERAAASIYQSVKQHFPGSRGAMYAAMQLADRRIFAVDSGNYVELVQEFRQIEAAGDFALRDEALFKEALLESLYGPAVLALAKVSDYEKKYPRGVFATVVRSMREELLALVVQDFIKADDQLGLIALAKENRDYLALALNSAEFLPRLIKAFAASGSVKAEIELFSHMAGKYGATVQGPFIVGRLLDDALKLNDQALAESSARRFLDLFPKHADAPLIREKLAGFKYQHNDLPAVASELGWLLKPKSRAALPVSYYYLAKALVKAGRNKEAAAMLQAFIGTGKSSAYLLDAYYERANASLAAGDRKAALAALRAGVAEAPKERRAQFLYKLGQVELQENHPAAARKYWEEVAADKTDSDWQVLAAQALEELAWQKELAGKKGLVSK